MISGGSSRRGSASSGVTVASTRSLRRRSVLGLLVPLLLMSLFGQAATSAPLQSPTFDEEFHIARAFAYTSTGDLRIRQNHHPLVSSLT